jgi:hypothetical protein
MADKAERADSSKEVASSMEEKKQTKLLDQLESGPWPGFVKDRRPAELTASGLRTKNLIKNFHLKSQIDVPIFRLPGGSGIARMAVECAFSCKCTNGGGAQGELGRPTMN